MLKVYLTIHFIYDYTTDTTDQPEFSNSERIISSEDISHVVKSPEVTETDIEDDTDFVYKELIEPSNC